MKMAKASATSANCSNAADRPRSISGRLRIDAPTSGTVPCTSATRSASTRAKWPISTSMRRSSRSFPAGQGNSRKNPGFGPTYFRLSNYNQLLAQPNSADRHGKYRRQGTESGQQGDGRETHEMASLTLTRQSDDSKVYPSILLQRWRCAPKTAWPRNGDI